jgi:hypothetical protein
MALAEVISCWGARTAQREHTTEVIRAVEIRKSAASFMSSVQGRGGAPEGRASGQIGWQSGGRAGWLTGGGLAEGPAG